jgi:ATP-dependent DNA ligase
VKAAAEGELPRVVIPPIAHGMMRIDGEAVIAHDDGTPDFHALRNRRRGREVVLYDGEDLRNLPLIDRKRRAGQAYRPIQTATRSSSLSI